MAHPADITALQRLGRVLQLVARFTTDGFGGAWLFHVFKWLRARNGMAAGVP